MFTDTYRLVSQEKLEELFEMKRGEGRTSGILLGATWDGTGGERQAVEWAKNQVDYPAVGVEKGGRSYFPDCVRLSMWAHYGVRVTPVSSRCLTMEKWRLEFDLLKKDDRDR